MRLRFTQRMQRPCATPAKKAYLILTLCAHFLGVLYVKSPVFLILLIFLSSTVTPLHAQPALTGDARENFRNAILRMQDKYKDLNKLHLIMSIEVSDSASAKPYLSEVADIKRDGNNYLYKFAGQEMLMNDKYLLMVDRTSKHIFCNERAQGDEIGRLDDPFIVNTDSLLQFYGEIVYASRTEGADHYRLYQKMGPVDQVDLFIDSASGLLKRIDYLFDDRQYVKIDFKVFNMNPSFGAEVFSEGNYLTVSKNTLVTTEPFAGYHISNVADH